jgi:PEGA domain
MRQPLCLAVALFFCTQFLAQVSQSSPSTKPAASNSAPSTSAPSRGFILEDGTPLKLRINRNVSSADAHTGETVDFEVLEEVLVNNVLVVPKGGLAFATVTEAQAKRRMARGGKLDINIDYVRLVDSEKAALRAVKEVKGGGHTGAMTGGIVATSLVFFPAAPFFLFMHGKDITIPKGTEITAYINGDMKLDVAKFQPSQPAAVLAATTTSPSTAAQGQLQISSDPAGADIEVDSNYVGNTPSTVVAATGQHVISIKKPGFKPWERKITVSSGQINVVAQLETSSPVSPASSSPSPVPRNGTATSFANSQSQPSADPRPAAMPVLQPAVLKSSEPSAPVSSESTGTVSITSDPSGADIFIDSVGRGRSPALVKLGAGKHQVQLVLNGYKDWVSEVDVKSGSIVNVTGELSK